MIHNFDKFINENKLIIRVLDVVIDEMGNVYNGKFGHPLVKGNVDVVKKQSLTIQNIKGSDNKDYIAGLDKNGRLVAPAKNIDTDGYLVDNNGERVKIQPAVLDTFSTIRGTYWRTGIEYKMLIPSVPTGWVNVKIDMEICKRVRRYSKGLGRNTGDPYDCFISKLNQLNKINDIKYRKRKRESVQSEMSSVMLLHYINEIKDFFDPSSSGFLFESFISGLIPGSSVESDNGKADITTNDGKLYQIKLYDHTISSIDMAMDKNDDPLDHYVICTKYTDRIEIVVIDGFNTEEENYLENFRVNTGANKFSPSLIKSYNGTYKYKIGLLDLEDKIDNISANLKESLNDLYSELSSFQYNVESIITGVDENDNLIDGEAFTKCYNGASNNLNLLKSHLDGLIKRIDSKFK